MNPRSLVIAGWIAIFSAVLTLPLVLVSIFLAVWPENEFLEAANKSLSLVLTALGIYILVTLRKLLHAHRFHAADLVIALLVGGFVVTEALEIPGALVAPREFIDTMLIAFAIVLAVLSAVLGFKVLPAATLVRGPMTTYAYLSIATGICFATLVLIPVGLITSLAETVCLAMVFFRESEARTPAASDGG
jgi:hypothetical protein